MRRWNAAAAALHSKGAVFSSLPRRNEMKPGHLHKKQISLACYVIASGGEKFLRAGCFSDRSDKSDGACVNCVLDYS